MTNRRLPRPARFAVLAVVLAAAGAAMVAADIAVNASPWGPTLASLFGVAFALVLVIVSAWVGER